MEDGNSALHRRSFVVHAEGGGKTLVVHDLATLRSARVRSLELLPAQILEWLSAGTDGETPAPHPPLSRSEARVVRLALDGLTNKQIGLALGVRLRTVESHLTAAYRKLGVHSRRELAAKSSW